MLPLYGALGPLGRAYNVAADAVSEFIAGLIWAPSLDEVSGNRVDPISGYNLTPTGSVKVAPRGPLGTSARFVKANSEQLYHTNINPDWSLGITQAFWFKIPPTATVNEGYLVFGQYGPIWGGGGWLMGDQNSQPGLLSLMVTNTTQQKAANWGYTVADGLWHYVALRYDPATMRASISVDAQTPVLADALNAHPVFSPSYKELRYGTQGFLGNFMDADLARAGVWNAHLSDATVLSLYNDGNGKDYADLAGDELTGLIAFHRMNETSGNRADSHGAYTLTDSNTVLSVQSGPSACVASAVAANSEYLSRANMELPASYTLSMWVEGFDGYPGNPVNGGVLFFAGSSYPYGTAGLGTNGGYYGSFLYSRAGEYQQAQPFYSNWVPYDEGNRWRFITYDYNASTRVGRIWIDNRPAPVVGDALTAAAHRGASDVFHLFGSNVMSSYSTNRFGPVGLWSEVLDDAKRLSIFNAGAAKLYSDLSDSDKTNLVSHWNMSEPSGTRYDSHGTNHLTDNNTVGTVVNAGGAMNNAGVSLIAASGQYLRTAAVSMDLSGGYTVSVWCRPTAKTAGDWTVHTILEKNHTWNYTYPFALTMNGVDSGNTLYFTAACANAAATAIQSHTYGWGRPWSLYQNRWVNLVSVFDPALGASSLKLYVNGELAPTLGGPLTGVPNNSVAQEISLGYSTNGFAAQFTGQIDAPLVWDTPFDAAKVATLFNAGRGLFHPDFELA